MSIHDGMVWDQWRREMVRRGLASTTMAQRRSLLRRWERWCASRGVDWRRATVRDVEDWLDLRADLGARTRYNDLSSLAALYAWARRAGIADVDPTADVLRPKLPQQLPRPCATDDLMTAIAAAGEPMRAMLVCMAWAGLRCCEVSSLDWSDVQLGDTPRMRVTGKGRRQRVIDLHPAVVGELRRLEVRRAGRVFRRSSGGAWTPGQVSREVSRHMATCGIAASAHQLRHWFASTVYEASGDLRVVQELLGHASPATTSVYTALSSRRRQMAVSSLPGLRTAKAPRP